MRQLGGIEQEHLGTIEIEQEYVVVGTEARQWRHTGLPHIATQTRHSSPLCSQHYGQAQTLSILNACLIYCEDLTKLMSLVL